MTGIQVQYARELHAQRVDIAEIAIRVGAAVDDVAETLGVGLTVKPGRARKRVSPAAKTRVKKESQ